MAAAQRRAILFAQHHRDLDPLEQTLLHVGYERLKQEQKYPGTTCASETHSLPEKLAILAEEFGEVAEAVNRIEWPREDPDLMAGGWRALLRDELIQVAAVAVTWAESL